MKHNSYLVYKTPNFLYCFPSSEEYKLRRFINTFRDMKDDILKSIERNHDYIIYGDYEFILRPYLRTASGKYTTFYSVRDECDNIKIDDLYHFRAENFTDRNRISAQFYGTIQNLYEIVTLKPSDL